MGLWLPHQRLHPASFAVWCGCVTKFWPTVCEEKWGVQPWAVSLKWQCSPLFLPLLGEWEGRWKLRTLSWVKDGSYVLKVAEQQDRKNMVLLDDFCHITLDHWSKLQCERITFLSCLSHCYVESLSYSNQKSYANLFTFKVLSLSLFSLPETLYPCVPIL